MFHLFLRVPSTLLCPKLTRDKFFQARGHPLCPRASTFFFFFIIVFYIHHVFLFLSVSLETGSQAASNKFSDGKFASLSGNFFAFTRRRRERESDSPPRGRGVRYQTISISLTSPPCRLQSSTLVGTFVRN